LTAFPRQAALLIKRKVMSQIVAVQDLPQKRCYIRLHRQKALASASAFCIDVFRLHRT
jgi:hypothetical protein